MEYCEYKILAILSVDSPNYSDALPHIAGRVNVWKSSETQLKMIGRPCLKDLSLCIEFFHHAIEGVVTGVVS